MTSSSSPSDAAASAPAGVHPLEHPITVRRSARWYQLGVLGPSTRDVWIAAHGYGQLASRFIRAFSHIASETCAIVAPEALSRFYVARGEERVDDKVGATWMTREDRLREIEDYVAYLDAVHDSVFERVERARARLTVLGFSQGVSTIARWIARARSARADRVVLCSGPLPPQLTGEDFAALRRAELLLVMGRADELARPEMLRREEARLRANGVTPTVIWFDGGHEVSRSVVAELAGA